MSNRKLILKWILIAICATAVFYLGLAVVSLAWDALDGTTYRCPVYADGFHSGYRTCTVFETFINRFNDFILVVIITGGLVILAPAAVIFFIGFYFNRRRLNENLQNRPT